MKRGINWYLDTIENQIMELTKDKDSLVNLIQRENELWYSSEQKKIEDQRTNSIRKASNELDWLTNACNDFVFKNIVSYQSVSETDQKEKFSHNWNEFWTRLKAENTSISFETPLLPNINDGVFAQMSFNSEKWKEIEERLRKPTIRRRTEKEQKTRKAVGKKTINHYF